MTPDDILRDLGSIRTLAGVVPWALSRTPPAEFVEVVVQDEFTHDVVVRVAPEVFIVFDTTWLGAVMAVAILDHHPSADELLRRRIAGGWVPRPTATRDGDVILGHAATCAMPGS